MLRYTDTAWMDDRTGPSTHVRRNLEGLMTFFPPSYLLSFAINEGNEPLADAPDLPLYLRSRMPGILGLTYRAADLTDDDQLALSREISLFKKLRDVQRDASGTLLTAQAAPAGGGPSWDAVQELSRSTGDAVIFAFQVDGAASGRLRHAARTRPRRHLPVVDRARPDARHGHGRTVDGRRRHRGRVAGHGGTGDPPAGRPRAGSVDAFVNKWGEA